MSWKPLGTSKGHKWMPRHPPMTSQLILDKLKKESLLESTLKDLTQRMSKVEANLQLVLQNQVTQTEILAKLIFSTYGETSLSLDDNKKGEKEQETQKEKEKEKVGQQITEDQRIKEHQQIKEPQQISSQRIIFWKEEKQLNLRSTNFKKAPSRP